MATSWGQSDAQVFIPCWGYTCELPQNYSLRSEYSSCGTPHFYLVFSFSVYNVQYLNFNMSACIMLEDQKLMGKLCFIALSLVEVHRLTCRCGIYLVVEAWGWVGLMGLELCITYKTKLKNLNLKSTERLNKYRMRNDSIQRLVVLRLLYWSTITIAGM